MSMTSTELRASPSSLVSSSQLHLHPAVAQELEIMIFLRDRTTLRVQLEDGQRGTASDFMEIVFLEQKLSDQCKEVFSLWLISPLLEVRLKPNHKPYLLAQQWEDLCDVYSDAHEDELVTDEPMMYFQRNVFFPPQKESQVTDTNTLLYLYHEAKYNILNGRYIVAFDDYHRLAGIQALIHLQSYDPRTHIEPMYRSHIAQFYPDHLCKEKRFLGWKSDKSDILAGHLQHHHMAISDRFKSSEPSSVLPQLYKKYLSICWSYPFYGAAYFPGQIEQPTTKLVFMRTNVDTDVWVAINVDGVCIIDRHKHEVLLSQPYTKLSWHLQECSDDEGNPPSLFLQFPCPDNEEYTKLLQVYSRQAKLMNALIETCVNIKKNEMQELGQDVTEYQNTRDVVDGAPNCRTMRIGSQLGKMCLTTYSPAGEKMD